MITFEKDRSTSLDYIYRQYNTDFCFGLHFHDSFEFLYVEEGEITVTIEKDKYVVNKGNGLLILPKQIHSYHTENHSKIFILIFGSSYVAKYNKQALLYTAKKPFFEIQRPEEVIEILKKSCNNYLLKSVLYYIVYLYTEGSERIKRDEKYNILMQNVFTYVEENYQKEINLKSLAKDLGYDYHYFSSIINTDLGTNFSSFLNEFRINKVCELMVDDSSTSISDLAYGCGYNSLRTFNRNLIEFKNMTPTEYRQNLIHE